MKAIPRLYEDLSTWWPLLSPPSDYGQEAAGYVHILRKAVEGSAGTCLELGAGGGCNASFMKRTLEMTLVDLSEGMLAESRRLNPENEHIVADMREVRLSRTFDVVFVHDAVSYMKTRDDLLAAMRTAFVHLRPGGAALFCPDHVAEQFVPATAQGGSDGEDGRAARFLEWTWDPDPNDEQCTSDYAYLLRTPDGKTRVEKDRHIFGLFSREVWLTKLSEAGFVPSVITYDNSEVDFGRYEVFVGKRPTS